MGLCVDDCWLFCVADELPDGAFCADEPLLPDCPLFTSSSGDPFRNVGYFAANSALNSLIFGNSE